VISRLSIIDIFNDVLFGTSKVVMMDYNENDLSYYQLQDELQQELEAELRKQLEDESGVN